jgi:hypothetical protein|tara:strand:- start:3473 stop:4045 length:573 start_codon:yes stop_codon:yes gene_type:complete
MKTYIPLLLALLFFSFTGNNTPKEETVYITPESFLYIKGTSNVNTFTCVYDAATLSRKIPVRYTESGNTMHFRNVEMELKNNGFNCGNKMINKDFHELLQTEHYPTIGFKLLKIIKNPGRMTAEVAIEIAGITKHYSFPIQANGELAPLEGVLCLNITDFDLTPPKKMMGMIVVREDIEIVFGLDLKVEG